MFDFVARATARAPLRLPLGGGGTDLPAYFRRFGGYLIAGAIEHQSVVSVEHSPRPGIAVAHRDKQLVRSVDDIAEPLLREALRLTGVLDRVAITSTPNEFEEGGLGSSGSYTVALLAALEALCGRTRTPAELAELACHIEIDRLAKRVGKQDQYAAAHGGLISLQIERDGSVEVEQLRISTSTRARLEECLCLFHSGVTRSASKVLTTQSNRLDAGDAVVTDAMHEIAAIGRTTREVLEQGSVDELGHLFHAHWVCKRRLAANISNSQFDDVYALARENGATGGKLIGAGGGGHFLLYCPGDRDALTNALRARGLADVPWRFQDTGVVVERTMAGERLVVSSPGSGM